MAIQYGLLVAGTVLLLIASWSWYQNWSNPALSACKSAQASCRDAARAPPATAGGNTGVVPPTTSRFASRRAAPRSGKLTENMLHEGFMDYGSEKTWNDAQAETSPADAESTDAYDPAADSLDKSVFDSHKEFVDESYSSSSGPSAANIERDDTNEVVKRWGLRKVDYTSVYSSDDARTVSSEYPEQVEQKTSSAESELF
jgi:hypothetical protein